MQHRTHAWTLALSTHFPNRGCP